MNNKNNKSKSIIDVYTQPIFVPEKLYVLRGVSKEEYNKQFCWDDDTSSYYDEKEYEALTQDGVIDKATKEYIIIVTLSDDFVEKVKKDKKYAVRVCSHEAEHVAHDMLLRCGINLDDSTNEVYAFVVGWAAECIYTTLIK